jgi:succinoglycan biosynthesis protein ExoA
MKALYETSSFNSIDISIIVPCRNEAKYIRETIRRIISQKGSIEQFSFELLLVDGQSDDGTIRIIEEETSENPHIQLISNEKRITPAAFNIGIRNAKGRYICILGAHAEVAEDYLLNCLKVILNTHADNVGGPWKAAGKGYVGSAVSLAFQSRFSAGGALSHNLTYDGEVDSVWGGFYRRKVFDIIGLFDEELVRNQDDELNYRLIRAGLRIWQSPTIRYSYICRDSLKKLFQQYFQYGYWKVRVIQKHRIPASIRHLVPGGFVGTLLSLFFLSLFFFWARLPLVLLLCLYFVANLGASLITCCLPKNWVYLPVMPIVFAFYHFGYGWGFLRGLVDFILLRKSSRNYFGKLTR